jgi:hypothetical protein
LKLKWWSVKFDVGRRIRGKKKKTPKIKPKKNPKIKPKKKKNLAWHCLPRQKLF